MGSALNLGSTLAASVYTLPRFHHGDFLNSIAWTMSSSDLLELMLKHFIQNLQICGMDSVFLQLLFHLFCVLQMATDTNSNVFSFLPWIRAWKNMSADTIQLQVKAFFMRCCIVFQSKADKNMDRRRLLAAQI